MARAKAQGYTQSSEMGWIDSPVEGLAFAPLVSTEPGPPRHALTVDLEDWRQSVVDHYLPVSDDFRRGLDLLLGLLDRQGVRATFFVLGNVARHAPDVIRDLDSAGHEVQTHGTDHTELSSQSPADFRADVREAKQVIEDLTGRAVVGYRAPRFSITARTIWALDILAELGFRYDSSVFPMRIRGYGVSGWYPEPHRIRTRRGAELTELPVATIDWFGRRWPIGGGGYFRLLPSGVIRRGLQARAASGRASVLYCHPHEFDPGGTWDRSVRLRLHRRLHQGVGRRRFAGTVADVLSAFSFGTIRELLATLRVREGR